MLSLRVSTSARFQGMQRTQAGIGEAARALVVYAVKADVRRPQRLLAPSIVLTEFLKIAGTRRGESIARLRLNLLKERGTRLLPLNEEMAAPAGSLLLAQQNVPIADALIASPVQTGEADYVVTDDPHYKILGVRTKSI